VTVKNDAGTIMATGTTSANVAPMPTPLPLSVSTANIRAYEAAGNACIATFALSVPRAQFYQLTIGTHGAPTYSFDDLQQRGWKVELSRGQ